jgi:outer membrane protein assembly factor BamA
VSHAVDPAPIGLLREHTIGSVAVTGADPALTATLRRVVKTQPGEPLEGAPVADDIRRLWTLGVLSDVQVDVASGPGGAAVTFAVTPQPIIDHVFVSGSQPDALELRRLRMLEGTPYEPQRVARIAAATQTALVYDGYVDAKVSVQRARGGLCVRAERGPRVVIDKLVFSGASPALHDVLASKLRGAKAGINHAGGIYDENLMSEDMYYLIDVYYELGRINTHVDNPKTERHGDRITVEIPIRESPVFRIGKVSVLEPGGSTIALGLTTGEVFVRSRVAAARDRLSEHAFYDVRVWPETKVDLERNTVDLAFHVEWRWPWHVLQLLRSH